MSQPNDPMLGLVRSGMENRSKAVGRDFCVAEFGSVSSASRFERHLPIFAEIGRIQSAGAAVELESGDGPEIAFGQHF